MFALVVLIIANCPLQGSNFPPSSANRGLLSFRDFYKTNIMDEKWYFISFVCASFVTREVEHLFCALQPFVNPILRTVSHAAHGFARL